MGQRRGALCCGSLLEGDAELYREVSAEVEPAIKLSREIIQELKEDIEELQGSNRELQNNNKELQGSNRELQNNNKELQESIRELHQDMENGCRRLVAALRDEGKSREETKALLMAVFALSEKSAGEKTEIYWKEQ